MAASPTELDAAATHAGGCTSCSAASGAFGSSFDDCSPQSATESSTNRCTDGCIVSDGVGGTDGCIVADGVGSGNDGTDGCIVSDGVGCTVAESPVVDDGSSFA